MTPVISCIQRGTRRDGDLADAYRDWLTAASGPPASTTPSAGRQASRMMQP